jgi:PucR C-terminal helix-turn-helix domain
MDSSAVHLTAVLDSIGRSLFDAVVLPKPEVGVADIVVYEAGHVSEIGPMSVIAALGPWDLRSMAALIDSLPHEPSAIVVKCQESARNVLLTLCAERGCALLVLEERASWVQVISMFQASMFHGSLGSSASSEPAARNIFELAEIAAEAIGGPVSIEDQRGWLIAYSSEQKSVDAIRMDTLLRRRAPEEFQLLMERTGTIRSIRQSKAPVIVPGTETIAPRVGIALAVGSTVLGTMWAICTNPTAAQLEGFSRAAGRVGLYLSRHQTDEVRAHRVEMEHLATLLYDSSRSPAMAAELGVAGRFHWVAAFSFHQVAQHELAQARARLDHRLALLNGAGGFGVRAGQLSNLCFAVISVVGAANPSSVIEWLNDVVVDPSAGSLPVVVGLGRCVSDLKDLPNARRDAERALAVARTGQLTSQICSLELDWAYVCTHMLLEVAVIAELDHLTPLAAVRQHDRTHSTDYEATLLAWLNHFGNVRDTAQSLNIHMNTVRYRLEHVGEIASLNLDDPIARFVLHAQLLGSLKR